MLTILGCSYLDLVIASPFSTLHNPGLPCGVGSYPYLLYITRRHERLPHGITTTV